MRLDMPIVETQRLYLRPVEEEDACDLYDVYKRFNVTKHVSFSQHTNVDTTLRVIKCAFLSYERQGIPQTWAIVLKDKDKAIGTIQIHTIKEDIGEIGYVLHEAYWKQGLMKEALKELLRVAFSHLKLRRLEAFYDIHNMASAQLLKGCGFQIEGTLRQYAKLSDNKYHDMILASILHDEWKERNI